MVLVQNAELYNVVHAFGAVSERLKMPVASLAWEGPGGCCRVSPLSEKLNTSSVNPCTNSVVPYRFDSPVKYCRA
jgi:hypothetical protein